MKVARYSYGWHGSDLAMNPNPEGDWCFYPDVAVTLDAAQKAIAEARSERDEAIDRAKVWEHNWSREVAVKNEVISWYKDQQAGAEMERDQARENEDDGLAWEALKLCKARAQKDLSGHLAAMEAKDAAYQKAVDYWKGAENDNARLMVEINAAEAQVAALREEVERLTRENVEVLYDYRKWNQRAETAEARLAQYEEALAKLRSYNVDVEAGRINYRPKDHIAVIDAALTPDNDGGRENEA